MSTANTRPVRLGTTTALATVLAVFTAVPALAATTYYVDQAARNAADTNPGTETAPWKTISRAASAKELGPGDTVLIRSGVYRETVDIKVSGRAGRPITFAAAPQARVVVKGSEIVRGQWTRLAEDKNMPEPFPRAFRRVWKLQLGEEFFRDPRYPGAYADKSRRWISQVFLNDDEPLQLIGPDAIYKNDALDRMRTIGEGLNDMITQSFFFEPKTQTLYLNMGGQPQWFVIEVGVRAFTLTGTKVHDLVIRGLEMRHNRQPGMQWAMVGFSECQRLVIEDCKVHFADFCGVGLYKCQDSTLRRCDLSRNGCVGLGLGSTEDCVVEDCTLLFNNYRRFCSDWGVAAGMKNIPGNKRTTIRRCEAAYTIEGQGIWFDTYNEDIRILENVAHHNGDCGIVSEINKGGGIIAGNFVFANQGRGIYVSGSEGTWVVHNTVAENVAGIVGMSRSLNEPSKRTRVLNNLLIRNYIAAENVTRGSDLTLEMSPDPAWQAQMGGYADYNVYAGNAWTPTMRHNWNENNLLPDWQSRFKQDQHGQVLRIGYETAGAGIRLLSRDGLAVAGPLPEEVTKIWQPSDRRQVGANIIRWPDRSTAWAP